jgi:uncharacterized membrane protein YoaK (UPF0700 family)
MSCAGAGIRGAGGDAVTVTDKNARRFTILAAVWAVLFVGAVVTLAVTWPGNAQLWVFLALTVFMTTGMGWEARYQRRRLRTDRGGL